jgi:hypothetical protein
MAKTLTPQTLDIVITRLTPKTVWCDLYSGRQSTSWEITDVSTFDTTQLVIGQRYTLKSKVVDVRCWNYEKKKFEIVQRFEWVTATIPPYQAPLASPTKKQRKMREANAMTRLVDTGDMFSW